MDEFEITCVVKDENGIITHCGVKDYGFQNVSIIENLISEETCSFFIYDAEIKKMNVYACTSPNGTSFLTTDPKGSEMDTLNFLREFDRPLLRQLIESVR